MIIDMHVHTVISGDSTATVEQYCRAIQAYRQYHPFDGIVLTEHREFKSSDAIQKMAEKYDVLIFQGIELDADFGHLLLYGITDQFLKQIDITQRRIDSRKVIKIIDDSGGIAVPAHPFRESGFGRALMENNKALEDISVIEEFNGSNYPNQNKMAKTLVEKNGLKGIGGSDAHFANTSWFLNCATEFDHPIHTSDDLVRELRQGHFRPVILDNSMLEDNF